MGQGSDPLNEYSGVSPVDGMYDASSSMQSDDSDYQATTREIEADIEQTRAQMSETINQIQERLNPHHLAEQAKEAVYDATIGSAVVTAKGMGSNMFETIKQNPLPAAIAALSIGWLMRKSTTVQSDYNYSQGQYRPYPQTGYQNYGQAYGGQPYAAQYGGGSSYYNQGSGYYNQSSGYSQHSPGIGERLTNAAGSVVGGVQNAAGSVVGGAQSMAGGVVDAAGNVVDATGNVVGSVVGGVQNMAGNVIDAAGNVVGSVVGGVQHMAGDVVNQVSYLGDQAREQAHYASNWFQRTLQENPLAVGAAMIVAGTAVGMAMPSTPVENRFMGEARDTLVERVQETAHETFEKVQAVASEASQVVQERVQSAVSETTEAVQDTVKLQAREQGLMGS